MKTQTNAISSCVTSSTIAWIMLLISSQAFAQWSINGANIYNSNTGNIGIGTGSIPTKRLEIVGFGSSGDTPLMIRNDWINQLSLYVNSSADPSHHAGINFLKSRGTYVSPSNVLADDRVAAFGSSIYLNGLYRSSATIEFYVGASPSATSYPGNIRFYTTATGSTSRVERMRVAESGNIGIGTPTPAYKLDVSGTVNATALMINGTAVNSSQWTTVGSNINFNSGVVSVGTALAPNGYKLAVGGKAIAEEVVVKLQANWPDYVFGNEYKLPSLLEVKKFIHENKHLPEVPSAEDVAKHGIRLGEMNATLLKKVEELTLYVIELKEEIDVLKTGRK